MTGKRAAAIVIVAAASVVSVAVIWANYRIASEPNGSNANGNPSDDSGDAGFVVLPDADPPTVRDSRLRVEKVAQGLALPTSMVFFGETDVLILEKNSGIVRLISDGRLQEDPGLVVSVNSQNERGLLGIAIDPNATASERSVFLYYTEDSIGDIRNRVYRHSLSPDGSLGEGTLILDLPGTPGPNHDGGKLTIGLDGKLYAVIGDLNRNGMLQNYASGESPDDTSVILRVDSSGRSAGSVLTHDDAAVNHSLSRYHAYGIRNSFGMDIDPVTGVLWDTENGPNNYDEINVVKAGFNSGWERVMGPIGRSGASERELVAFEGSHYRDPAFSWRSSLGLTDIEFLNSTALGEEYQDDIFVGDFNNGNLYYFKVNESRDGVFFGPENPGLADLVADNGNEMEAVTFGTGFEQITDIETGPDGFLYVLSLRGDLYRIVPDA